MLAAAEQSCQGFKWKGVIRCAGAFSLAEKNA
jgi:hypothetical protein